MKSFLQGTWLGHPLHAALVHFPAALWPTALVLDIFSNTGGGSNALVQLAFFALLLGLVVTLLALPTGLADWSDLPRTAPAWRLGLIHLALNVTVTVLVVLNLGLRLAWRQTATSVESGPLLLSLASVALLLVSGYLGGRMVYHQGVSIARDSHGEWRKRAEAGQANVPHH